MRHQQRGRGYWKPARCRGVEELQEKVAVRLDTANGARNVSARSARPGCGRVENLYRLPIRGCCGPRRPALRSYCVSTPITSDPNPTRAAVSPVAGNPASMRIGTDDV